MSTHKNYLLLMKLILLYLLKTAHVHRPVVMTVRWSSYARSLTTKYVKGMVNPDCGLKACHWDETKKALVAIVEAAKELRLSVKEPVSL